MYGGQGMKEETLLCREIHKVTSLISSAFSYSNYFHQKNKTKQNKNCPQCKGCFQLVVQKQKVRKHYRPYMKFQFL